MATATLKRPKVKKTKKAIPVLKDYDAAADAKNRISLRGAKTKYFHVKPLSNGGYLLEPRVLVAPKTAPGRTNKSALAHANRERKLSRGKARRKPSCYDLARDLAGSIKGLPKDIATNPKYMEGFGE